MTRRTIMLLVFVCWANRVQAQPAYLEQPTKLRVTGMLLPVTEPSRDDLVTVSIVVQETPLLLRVGKVEELTHTEREQAVKWGVLLRQVRFYGPDALIGRLLEPTTTGKVLAIEGQLDTRTRQFLVSAVEEATDSKPQRLEGQ